jgi:hypothetical protein
MLLLASSDVGSDVSVNIEMKDVGIIDYSSIDVNCSVISPKMTLLSEFSWLELASSELCSDSWLLDMGLLSSERK